MSEWSLSQLLSSLHEDIEQRLSTVRKTINHPGSKGDASENVWIDMLDLYLPKRYQTAKAFVVDSRGILASRSTSSSSTGSTHPSSSHTKVRRSFRRRASTRCSR